MSPRDIAPFGFYARIAKAVETDDGEWIVEGPLSEPSPDLQGEEMDMAGLRKALGTFTALGSVVDWEHLYEKTRNPEAIIGKGVAIFDAPHPVTGVVVPWLRVRLLKAKRLARQIWEHLQAGGDLGFSVAGAALRKAGSRILESMITTVGITAVPVVTKNSGCLRIAKSLADLRDYDGLLADVRLPIPEELAGEVLPMFRALAATGDLPHAGPGVSALMVEDLSPRAAAAEGQRRKRKRRRLAASADAYRKAVAYHLGENLAGALAAHR